MSWDLMTWASGLMIVVFVLIYIDHTIAKKRLDRKEEEEAKKSTDEWEKEFKRIKSK